MANPDVTITLDEAVAEVLSILTGLDLDYDPNQDRYRQVARAHLVDGVQTHVDDIAPGAFAGAKGDQGRGAAAVRFRHAVTFLRWRPDREPRSCTLEQIERATAYDLGAVLVSDAG